MYARNQFDAIPICVHDPVWSISGKEHSRKRVTRLRRRDKRDEAPLYSLALRCRSLLAILRSVERSRERFGELDKEE